jgi:hypothetical protein
MKHYAGTSYDCGDETLVSDAIVTRNRISIVYDDGEGYEGHVVAKSTDGIVYRGQFGYPEYPGQETIGNVEFRRYTNSRGQVVLVGKYSFWHSGNEGVWLVELEEPKRHGVG